MSLIGQMLGQYQIVELLGAGGMGAVYKAYQPGLERDVAVKVLPAHHALTPGFKERFVREAKAVAQLNHPNILPIFDVGVEGDLSYFVMQYVSGGTLSGLLGQPMALLDASRFIEQIAEALDYAHEHRILHRDVKPSNILIENEWLLLADFGLAKSTQSAQGITDTGTLLGTPAYVSPEQAEGSPLDRRADVYSLGVVLYEMLTGRVPYQAETPIGVLLKHISEAPPSPRKYNPDLSREIEYILFKALAKNPADRYDRAGDLAEAFRQQVRATSASPLDTIPLETEPAHLFISYKRGSTPDEQLAAYLYDYLTDHGHDVFMDQALNAGVNWLNRIDQQIKGSDYLVVLLSGESADSEMVQAEIRRAYGYRKIQGHPRILPVRVAYQGLLPYAIDVFLDPLQYVAWQDESDTLRVGQEILAAVAGRMSPKAPVQARSRPTLSEDGRPISHGADLTPPLSEFDPRMLDSLEAPGGVVKLRDRFYIERPADALLKREVSRWGTTTTIRAPRQTGKSSLLVRGVHYARQNGAKVVTLDLQRVDSDRLTSPDLFLHDLAELIVRKLRLDVAEVEKAWRGSLGPQDKLTYLMEDYILPESDSPIILALDEVDRLLQTSFHSDFFALLRAWHNSRALENVWDKLNIIMVISTEPYLLIADVNQSPFNVGLKLYLEDFNEAQVHDLNRRHSSPVSEDDFPQLMELLHGHPYLTRKALYTLVSEGMSWPQLTAIVTADHGPFGDHLRRHHWLLRDEPILQETLKQITQEQPCSDDMSLFRLLQAGLIKGSGERYTCRCDLYRQYFADKL